ncbi:MAG: CotH kinase family protein [Defluviitaleaceae bacterium]|nr:CotH kinase family protein [Defluviitaleaceae bacterium]
MKKIIILGGIIAAVLVPVLVFAVWQNGNNGTADYTPPTATATETTATTETSQPAAPTTQSAAPADFAFAAPTFSHPSGFFTQEFDLTLAAEPGAIIRYTLDGSEPTADSPIFNGAIRVHSPAPTEENSPLSMGIVCGNNLFNASGCHYYRSWWWHDSFPRTPRLYYNGLVVRARAFNANGDGSATATQSFFVENNGRGNFNTRIISISMEPEYFADPVVGMYHNWSDRDLRPMVYAEIFYPDGTLMFSQFAEGRVSGNWSRRHPKKSLRLNFNRGDGVVYDMAALIPDSRQSFYSPLGEVADFKHLSMRISDWDRTTMRDTLTMMISEPLRPDIQNASYGAVFVNGEFWGMYCLREHRSDVQLAARYPGVNPNSIVVLEVAPGGTTNNQLLTPDDPLYPWAGSDGRLPSGHPLLHVDYDEGRSAFERDAYASWMEVIDTINGTDMSLAANFAHLQTLICIDNFIDYFLVYYHFDNWDWPGNNFIMWRTETYYEGIPGADGRWRFFLHDFDEGMNEPHFDRMRHFTTRGTGWVAEPSWAGMQSQWAVDIWYNLFQNAEFRALVAARYSTYLGTVFNPIRTNAVIDRLAAYRQPTIASDFYRWRLDSRHGEGTERWLNSAEPWYGEGIMRVRSFLERRADYSLDHLRNYFNRTDRANLALGLDTSGFTEVRWQTDSTQGWFDISGAQIRADLFDRGNIADYGFEIGDFRGNYIRGLPITITAMPLTGYIFSHFEITGGISGTFNENNLTITPPPNTDESITVLAIFTAE